MNKLFKAMSKINVNENTEQKGQFTYLSWTYAWNELMKTGADVTYKVLPVEYHQDGSATVHTEMTVVTPSTVISVHTEMTVDGVTFPMYLPVLDFKNKAIANPNAFDINTARMRCLVKNIAMFGLGIYIYAGEDLPMTDPYEDLVGEYKDTIQAIKDGIATEDLSSASEAWFELDDTAKKALWRAPTKGGCFTTIERDVMKSSEFRLANGKVEEAA